MIPSTVKAPLRWPAPPSATAALALLCLGGCSGYQAVDTAAVLRDDLARELGTELEIPFELPPDLMAHLDTTLRPAPRETYRVEQVLDFIFRRVGLEYSLAPTRSAAETVRAREGNCLSFVNLFVGVGRHLRLNPFYVEVTDFQRWSYRDGMVVSQGHIVAGLYVAGELKTYDFLPYRPKAYKSFTPIDDRTATAHYYNNLGAERLLAGDLEGALPLLETAVRVQPAFRKALNNLGAAYTRAGRATEAVEVLERGIELHPDDVPLLTNLVRAHQSLGGTAAARTLLDRIAGANTTNPFFYLYRAELALAEGDPGAALIELREALRRDSEVPEVHVGLVKAYLALGDTERARHHLARALRLDATNEDALRFARLLGS